MRLGRSEASLPRLAVGHAYGREPLVLGPARVVVALGIGSSR